MSKVDGDGSEKRESEDLAALKERIRELEQENAQIQRRNRELALENTMIRREWELARSERRPMVPSLLTALEEVLDEWRPSFRQERVYRRARDLALGFLLNVGRNTVTGALCALGCQFKDWTSYYRIFSRARFDPSDLFGPLVDRCGPYLANLPFIPVAIDDTSIPKEGKRIGASRVLRDPLSPSYRPNLSRRLRMVQGSALLRPEGIEGPSRAIPIGFANACPIQRPKRNSPPEAWAVYHQARKRHNLGRQAADLATAMHTNLAKVSGLAGRDVIWCVDGSMANRTFLRNIPEETFFIARARGDCALFRPANSASPGDVDKATRRVYGDRLQTPNETRGDERVEWQRVEVYAARKKHSIRFKEMSCVLWKSVTKRQVLRLIVVAPLGYRPTKNHRLLYRKPAFLLTSHLTSSAQSVLQAYIDRWEIEVNFREEKAVLGLAEPQVFSDESVERLPAFLAATYGALLLASLSAFGPKRTADYHQRPAWRREKSLRPSLHDLRTRVRREAMGFERGTSCIANPSHEAHFPITSLANPAIHAPP